MPTPAADLMTEIVSTVLTVESLAAISVGSELPSADSDLEEPPGSIAAISRSLVPARARTPAGIERSTDSKGQEVPKSWFTIEIFDSRVVESAMVWRSPANQSEYTSQPEEIAL